jgi:hypothetical protein
MPAAAARPGRGRCRRLPGVIPGLWRHAQPHAGLPLNMPARPPSQAAPLGSRGNTCPGSDVRAWLRDSQVNGPGGGGEGAYDSDLLPLARRRGGRGAATPLRVSRPRPPLRSTACGSRPKASRRARSRRPSPSPTTTAASSASSIWTRATPSSWSMPSAGCSTGTTGRGAVRTSSACWPGTAPGRPDKRGAPQAVERPPVSQTDCPGYPAAGLPDSGHATGWIWLAEVRIRPG